MAYTKYHQAVKEEMDKFALDEKVIFVGQQVASEDFYDTLKQVPLEKRIEMPVAEEMQMGYCTGLALEGYIPICIFQRMDFLLRASDQIVNHLDKIVSMSEGKFNPKVIIRTTIGNKFPMDAGPQHTQDLTEAFKLLVKFPVIKVTTEKEVREAYEFARVINGPIMIIEDQTKYYE